MPAGTPAFSSEGKHLFFTAGERGKSAIESPFSIKNRSLADLDRHIAVCIGPVPELAVFIQSPSPERAVLLDRYGVSISGVSLLRARPR